MADAVLRFDTALDVSGLNKGLSQTGALLTGAFKLGTAAITATTAAVGAAIGIGASYNSQVQNLSINLGTLLGGAEAAAQQLEYLKEYAAKTPFELSGLAQTSQTLLSFGLSVGDANDAMKMLGDVSLGNKEKFSSLALTFGQMSSAGRLMGQDLLQFINAGFNPLQEIAKKTGKSMAELKEEMSDGAISAEMVTEAFKSATGSTGMFYKGLERASTSMTGVISTLQDNFKSLLGEVSAGFSSMMGTDLVPMALQWVEQLTTAFRTGGMEALTTTFGDVLGEALAAGVSMIPNLVGVSMGILKGIGGALYDNRDIIIGALIDVFASIGDAIPILGPAAGLLTGLVETFNMMLPLLPGLATAWVAYNVAVNASTIAMAAAEVVAMGLFTAINVNPIILAASLLAGAGVLIYQFVSNSTAAADSANELTAEFKGLNDELGKNTALGDAIAKYKTLRDEIDTGKLSTEKLAEKQDELNKTRQWIIDNSDGVVTAESAISGQFDEQLTKVEELTKAERILLETRLKNALADISTKRPELEQSKVDMAEKEAEALRRVTEETAKQTEIKQKLIEANTLIESGQTATAEGQEKLNTIIGDTAGGIAGLNQSVLDYDSSIKGLGDGYETAKKNTEATDAAIQAMNTTIIEAARQGMPEAITMADKLGLSYKEVAKEAETTGNSTEKTAEKVEDAAGAYRALADAADKGADAFKSAAESKETDVFALDELVNSNKELFAQYPQLYAAMDKGTTYQEKAKNVAIELFKVRRDALIQEKEDQIKTTNSVITSLENQLSAAKAAYAGIAQAATFAAMAQAGVGAVQAGASIKIIEEQMNKAKADAARIKKEIDAIKATPMPTFGSGGGGARKDPVQDATEKIEKWEYVTNASIDSVIQKYTELRDKQAKGSDAWIEADKKVKSLQSQQTKEFETEINNRMKLYKMSADYTKEGEINLYGELLTLYQDDESRRIDIMKNIKGLQDSIRDDNIKAEEDAIQARIDKLSDAKTDEIDIQNEIQDVKLQYINEATIEEIRLDDEALANKLSNINDVIAARAEEIRAISSGAEADIKASQERLKLLQEEQDKTKETRRIAKETAQTEKLQAAVSAALTPEEATKAQEQLNSYLTQLEEDEADRQLQAAIKLEQDKQKAILEEKKKAISDLADVAKEQYKAEQQAIADAKSELEAQKEEASIVKPLADTLDAEKQEIKDTGKKAGETLAEGVEEGTKKTADPIMSIIEAMTKSYNENSGQLNKIVVTMFSDLNKYVESANFGYVGASIMKSMITEIENKTPALVSAMKSAVNAAMQEAMKISGALQITGAGAAMSAQSAAVPASSVSSYQSTSTASTSNNYYIVDQATKTVSRFNPRDMTRPEQVDTISWISTELARGAR